MPWRNIGLLWSVQWYIYATFKVVAIISRCILNKHWCIHAPLTKSFITSFRFSKSSNLCFVKNTFAENTLHTLTLMLLVANLVHTKLAKTRKITETQACGVLIFKYSARAINVSNEYQYNRVRSVSCALEKNGWVNHIHIASDDVCTRSQTGYWMNYQNQKLFH